MTLGWTYEKRMAARERFWSPLLEMLSILEKYRNDEDSVQSILNDPMAWIDSGIVGNRMKSIVCKRAMLKLIRDRFACEDPVETEQVEEQYPDAEWVPQNPNAPQLQWYPVFAAGHTVEHLMYTDHPRHWAGRIRIDGEEMGYAEAQVRYLKPIKTRNEIKRLNAKAVVDRELSYEAGCNPPPEMGDV